MTPGTNSRVRVASLLVVAAVWSADAAIAHACEPTPCQPGALLPAGGMIPANAPELRWHVGMWRETKTPAKHVRLTSAGKKVPVAIDRLSKDTFRIKPNDPLVEGATYELEVDNLCEYIGPKKIVSTFTVGPSSPLPKDLGTLERVADEVGPLKIGTSGGSCDVEEPAVWGDYRVKLSAEAKPWAALIDFTAMVDGKQWRFADDINAWAPPGESILGRGKARVYARCASPSYAFEGAGEGRHELVMRGSVFASGTTLETPSLALGLSCKDGVSPGSAPAAAGSAAPQDASKAGTSTEQTTTTPGASTPAGGSKPAPGAKSASGCMVAPDREEGEAPLGALALLLVVVLRRRS